MTPRLQKRNETFRIISENSRINRLVEYAAELEEEIEANKSMDSENNRKEVFFANTSETLQAFEI